MKLHLLRKYFLIFFVVNIIISLFLMILNTTEIKKFVNKNCKIFVEINISDTPPVLFYEYDDELIKHKILAIFFNEMKNKYKIINSDNGLIINKYVDECNKILKNIEKEIQNVQLAKMITNTLNKNKKLYNSEEFKPFKKSYNFNLEIFDFIIALLNSDLNYKIIEIKQIKKYNSFSNMNIKIGPSLLILIFGNLLFYVFYFYRKRLNKIF